MTNKKMDTLIEERCVFFHLRIKTYAELLNLDENTAIAKLQRIAFEKGAHAITTELDAILPERLHSSRMPV